MKISIGFWVSLLSVHLLASAVASEPYTGCPAASEIPKCTCYPSALYISCNDLAKPFNITKDYRLKSLMIFNKLNLPIANDNNAKFILHVDTLVIRHEEFSPDKLPNLNNLESFYMLSTSAVQIVSNQTVKQSLDVASLSSNLTSLSISDVMKMENFEFIKFENLKHLRLENVGFLPPVTDVDLFDRRLTLIQIINVTSLNGIFAFKPKANTCLDDEKIVIDLRNTKDLEYFDFSNIFNDTKCSYKIDLSGTSMRYNFLSEQAQNLAKQAEGKFYLIMRNVPAINCDCNVRNLYQTHSDYVHSVQCNTTVGVKYLSEAFEQKLLNCSDTSASTINTSASVTTPVNQTTGTTVGQTTASKIPSTTPTPTTTKTPDPDK